jgi:hypothetical protein
MVKRKITFSGVDRVIAMALAVIWIGAALIGAWVGLRHGRWAVLIIGPLGLGYGVLWARAARKGRRLHWRESVLPWR